MNWSETYFFCIFGQVKQKLLLKIDGSMHTHDRFLLPTFLCSAYSISPPNLCTFPTLLCILCIPSEIPTLSMIHILLFVLASD